MQKTDITPVLDKIEHTVATHQCGVGQYARWLWQNAEGSRELGVNPYGCADAANILYTLNRFPRDRDERDGFVKTMQNMQGNDGLFREKTHHFIHTTAHCTAALELFDAMPAEPCEALLCYRDTDKLYELLDNLDWEKDPWSQSHKGAGIYVVMNLTGKADMAWNRAYFDWFWENADPETGFWHGKREKASYQAPLYFYMAGGFHYMFNHEYGHMPLRYPEKIIDSCIRMYDEPDMLPKSFGGYANFIEIDWIFCLTRASRQTPYRYYDVRDRIEDFAAKYLDFWFHADYDKNESINDLHMLFGGICGLCELQQYLRGTLLSEKPLRLVLDRRPFI